MKIGFRVYVADAQWPRGRGAFVVGGRLGIYKPAYDTQAVGEGVRGEGIEGLHEQGLGGRGVEERELERLAGAEGEFADLDRRRGGRRREEQVVGLEELGDAA